MEKYVIDINGTTYNFRDHFANGGNNFGVQDGTSCNYYIGGGGILVVASTKKMG